MLGTNFKLKLLTTKVDDVSSQYTVFTDSFGFTVDLKSWI